MDKGKMYLYVGVGLAIFGLAPLLTGYYYDKVLTQTIGGIFLALGTFNIGRWYQLHK